MFHFTIALLHIAWTGLALQHWWHTAPCRHMGRTPLLYSCCGVIRASAVILKEQSGSSYGPCFKEFSGQLLLNWTNKRAWRNAASAEILVTFSMWCFPLVVVERVDHNVPIHRQNQLLYLTFFIASYKILEINHCNNGQYLQATSPQHS